MHGFMIFCVAFDRLAVGRGRWGLGNGLELICRTEAESKGSVLILA